MGTNFIYQVLAKSLQQVVQIEFFYISIYWVSTLKD